MREKIKKVLKEIIISLIIGYDTDNYLIHENINLIDDFGFGSIEIIQLIIKIEKTFQIKIKDEDLLLDNFSDYKVLTEIIQRELEAKS